ncbi:AdeC/AdeK/OprM family multidrug efflux complex outer membrane factor [Geothrix sp. 21YS21S-4]|uniref:AdeC/AdeK/OprM family multidrug efflux complex outer membrane factor n=1 Tax=Geothrix sp. 21YS21S-4 TaxID=3068889 RepID=UPI0027BAD2B7|nr:AdeC/AdeK/OprM family multidrug efflux complex outer membrane factor [Geothrix sp. 21YS21S-4]
MSSHSRTLLPFALPLALAGLGCVSMAPRYRTPEPPVPKAWPEGPSYKAAGSGALAADLPWQDFFTDARLRKVLDLALRNNRDLRIAALNTEKARAYYRIQRAELFPSISAVGQGSRQRLPASVSGTGESIIAQQYSASVAVTSWELDFFGRVRSLKNRALEEYLATEQARNSAQVALLSEVANAYLALAADRESLKLAQDTLTNQEDSHKLVRRRFEVGASSELDAYRAQVSAETARADVARYTRAVALDENALALLAGAPVPAEWLPQALGSVAAVQDVAPGLPSDVLAHRPDILMAENQLKAANANIGAARAAFFPRISLTSTFGSMDAELSGLFKSGSRAWSVSPQAVLPIFDMGARRANLKVAQADRDIYLAQYEKAIQMAFKEVADALAERGTLAEQLAAQETLTQALEGSYRLAQARYTAGIDGYLGVLDAQRSLYAAQQGLISLRQAKHGNLVGLYRVLGGGWKPSAS